MDGVIDPPSSAHLLTPTDLRDKAASETGFLALRDGSDRRLRLRRRNGPTDFYVGKLAVEPAHAGQGIGKR